MALGSETEPYDMIVIGKGSAAAYYLESVPQRYESIHDDAPLPLTILVIGEDDPWAGARGHVKGTYGQNINQASQVLAHRGGKVPSTSQAPQDRLDWANKNARILDTLAEEVVTATVTNICKVGEALTGRQKFKVSASNREFYFGHKIVIATGAGIETEDKGHKDYHMVPPQVTPVSSNPNVMNLDKFMKMAKGLHLGKKVAILGPTAGTDAVMQAGTLGYSPDRVWWLMRNAVNTTGFLNVYPGQDPRSKKNVATIIDNSKKRILSYVDNATFKLQTVASDQVRVECTPVGESPLKDTSFVVDFFVYSTGQTGANTLTAPPESAEQKAKSFLDADLREHLEPVYDINQRLGEKVSAPWQHVTAVQLEGSTSDAGLMIIGAAAFQVTGRMDHNFLQFEYKNLLNRLKQYSGFESAAGQTFRELLSEVPLKNMPRLSVNDCEIKEDNFLLTWQEHWQSHLANFTDLQLIEKGWAVEAVEEVMQEGEHLCYLFMQRTQAAQYLYNSNGELKSADMSVQKMLNPTHTMPAALQDCRLLAAVNANASAINASSPKALTKKTDLNQLDFQVNFLESKTELRVYLSAHYPNISDTDAEAFIARVGEKRKAKGNMGFELHEIVDFEFELEALERKPARRHRRHRRRRH